MQWRNGHGQPNPRRTFRVVCRRSVRNIGYPSLISTSGSLDMHQVSFFIVVIQGDVNLIGRIYIIKNQVNDKVYIGRTTKRVEERFKQHIRDARSSAKSRRKLINAIRELGEDKFWVEQLEEIEFYSNELQELETHYIQKFNSIETGYNAVCDNGMDSYQEISDSQKEEIARKRVDGFSNIEIAAMYNISMSLAQKICCEKGVESRAEGHVNNNPVKVVMYNKSFYPLKVFQRIYEAKNEIDAIRKRNGKAELLAGNFYAGVKSQALKGNLYQGYRFQYLDDLIYDGRLFRQIFDIENYKNGKPYSQIKCYGVGTVTICGNITQLIRVNSYRDYSIDGLLIVSEDGNVLQINDILTNNRYNFRVPIKRKLEFYYKYPHLLAERLRKGANYSTIARENECSPNAVKKLCIKLGFDANTISLMSDAEYEKLIDQLNNT